MITISNFTSKNWLERKKAAKLSTKLDDEEEIKAVLPKLIKMLEDDENDRVRAEVAQSLSKFGDLAEEAVPALTNAVKKDNAKNVRLWSIIALGEIGPQAESAIGPLLETIQEAKSKMIVKNALLALGKIGSKNKKVLPALKKFRKENSEWWVNSMIDSVIEQISGEPTEAS